MSRTGVTGSGTAQVQDAVPLSHGQQRVWLLSELATGPAALNLVMAVRLQGWLNAAALRHAFDDVAARHEILRSVVAVRDNQVAQLTVPQRPPVRRVDLAGLDPAARAQVATSLLREETDRPFDLTHGPVARFTVITLGPAEHLVAVATHHAFTDGWSMSLLAGEVSALFAAYLAGRPAPLRTTPPAQYRDFVQWQRTLVEQSGPELKDWAAQLGDLADAGLPGARQPPDDRRFAAAGWSSVLPPRLTSRLNELRRQEGGSTFMLVLAALMTLVHRLDGRRQVTVGTLAAGRTRPEFESLLGYFGNTLAIQCEFGPGVIFREAWRRVRERCVAAYAHQDLPFDKVLETLASDRGGYRARPITVVCVMQQPAPVLELPGLAAEAVDVAHVAALFDLVVEVSERVGALHLTFRYDTDVLDEATVRLLGGYLRRVLTVVCDDLDSVCERIPLDRPSRLGAGAGPVGHGADLHELFELQMNRTPDAVAVVRHDVALTYRALNARAAQVALELIRRGVVAGELVGVCLGRSLKSVTALLGVLKAGAGYVPLDPAQPDDRLGYLLGDSGVRVVVTDHQNAARLGDGSELVIIDRLANPSGRGTGPWPAVAPDSAAYLIYTSGSIGGPKGVVGTHRGVVNRLRWMWAEFPFRPGERACHRTPLSFVDSVSEVLGPLLAGVPVEIIDEELMADPEGLVGRLSDARVSRIVVVPSLLRVLVDVVPELDRRLPLLRTWVSSGERLALELASRFHRTLPDRSLINLYGSTEVSADATAATVTADAQRVTIGRPIDGVSVEVVETDGSSAPTLAAGELAIGGAALARGYHRRPGETAARFRPDISGIRPGARAFHTRDVARWTVDGQLEYLGRLDDQIKIRGMRVEPGEVEEALESHPAVAQAAVVAWPDPIGSATLAAYVVLRSACSVSTLQSFLRGALPRHLVPSTVVEVDALPHTASGKVDRRGLPKPDELAIPDLAPPVAPATDSERAVADVFAGLLPIKSRSVHDDFFALGGHSILAITAIYQLRERCGVDVRMRDIFDAPTIIGLARRIDTAARATAYAPVEVHLDDRHAPFPLTDVQQAYWVGREAGFELGNVATHAYFEVDASKLTSGPLQKALRRLIDRHPALRTIVRSDGMQQVLNEVPLFVLPVRDLRRFTPAERERRLVEIRNEMSHQVHPPDRWPLFDMRLSLLPEDRSRLHVSIDALVADAYSVRILMDELAVLHHDPEAELDPLELTFRDCVIADVRARDTPAYQRDLGYWRSRLASLPTGPELPLLRSPDTVEQPRFRRWSAVLDATAWADLRRRCSEAGLSPSTAVLGAFAEVLTTWSARPHYTLTLTLFTRPEGHPQVNRIVGDFTSLTLLEVDHREGGSFLARARRLQERLWEDLDHRLVSGVTVLREWTRQRGGRPGLLAPVVFTSNLGLDPARGGTTRRDIGELGFALTQTPQLYLDYQVAETPAGLVISWDAVAELFPPGLVDAMHHAHVGLLGELAAGRRSWDDPIGDLLPAPQRERRRAVNTTASPPVDLCLHELVVAVAARTPEAIAVVAPDRNLSFRDLVAHSARVAHRLHGMGVRRGELVGVAADKGWQQVVAVMGVAAAGAAFVPLDPGLPAARMALLVRQTEVRLVLTRTGLRGTLPGLTSVTELAVDDDADWAGQLDTLPAVQHDHRDLAYTIFTSGSTGAPKGVMIDHRGAVNTIADINRRFQIGPDDRVLGLSSLSFDLSIWDIFGALGAGGAVVLPDPDHLRDPGHWLELCERHHVTVWNSVPALMGLAAEHALVRGAAGLRRLRVALLSGDWIPLDLPGRVRLLAPRAQVVSLGGATEASIWSVFHITGPGTPPDWTSVPYGQPLANQRLHVLDGGLLPRPDWVPGDLYIGGDGLAIGYWADAELTAGSFVVHPQTGDRLYRTGDLARYRPDGNLEFLGRKDRQVKINGFRVELGEIESALSRAPGILACAVTTLGPSRGEKRLAAYYVAAPGMSVGAATLRARLAAVLPSYLVPGTFTALDALPLTANGKVDHEALASAGSASSDGTRPSTVPPAVRAPDELVAGLARLWAHVLGVERVDPDETFFELGGTSLVAVRLLRRLESTYDVKIPLVRLYEAPTVARLATEIAALTGSADRRPAPGPGGGLTADPSRRYEPFPLTAIQEAYWLGRRQSWALGGVATHSYVELDVTELDVDRLERAVRALVERHDALRTVVRPDGRQHVLATVPAYTIKRSDLAGAPASEAQAALEQLRSRLSHATRTADRWPLFDIHATRLDPMTVRLHIGVDLLIADAFSFRILQRELMALYHADDATLAPLRCTFRDYVLAVERLRESPDHREAETYWRSRLGDLPPAPRLPLRIGVAEPTRPRFERAQQILDAPEWTGLKRAAAARNLTPSGLLCAAFSDVLALWSQSSRFTLNLTTFNRLDLHTDIDAVVGDFTSTTLLAVDATSATFTARASRLQQQIFQDLQHRQFSGIEVIRLLRADPALREVAVAPVVFTSMLVPEPNQRAAEPAPRWNARPVYSVSQTPQVLLDHQVYEHDGSLTYSWDHVADAFPPGLINSMFDGYGRLLRSLLTDGAYWEVAPGWPT